jgi:hypothetical protein
MTKQFSTSSKLTSQQFQQIYQENSLFFILSSQISHFFMRILWMLLDAGMGFMGFTPCKALFRRAEWKLKDLGSCLAQVPYSCTALLLGLYPTHSTLE